jgi:hypothetical protein
MVLPRILIIVLGSQNHSGENRELDGSEIEEVSEGASGGGDSGTFEEEDGPWYMGKARDEFRRRMQGNHNGGRAQAEEEDPIQVWSTETKKSSFLSHPALLLVGPRAQKCGA